jgi:MFS family permease
VAFVRAHQSHLFTFVIALPSHFIDGRRPIYLFSLPTLCIGSIGVAFSHSIPTLLFWRILQAFGCSSGMSVGASVIGDIYRLEHRGTAMGIFFGVSHFVLISYSSSRR